MLDAGAKVLVVGGAGFVGSNLVRLLLGSEAQRVVVVDNFLAPFDVVSALNEQDGRLVFTSRQRSGVVASASAEDVRRALLNSAVREIIWNHASFDQYVALALALPRPLRRKRVAFDVGRYDSYGVYRFEQLAKIAAKSLELVANALATLLGPARTTVRRAEVEER